MTVVFFLLALGYYRGKLVVAPDGVVECFELGLGRRGVYGPQVKVRAGTLARRHGRVRRARRRARDLRQTAHPARSNTAGGIKHTKVGKGTKLNFCLIQIHGKTRRAERERESKDKRGG